MPAGPTDTADGPREPVPADQPLPPGANNVAEVVDQLDQRIRSKGSADIADADAEADAVEDSGDESPAGEAPAASDSDRDPTDDGYVADAGPA